MSKSLRNAEKCIKVELLTTGCHPHGTNLTLTKPQMINLYSTLC